MHRRSISADAAGAGVAVFDASSSPDLGDEPTWEEPAWDEIPTRSRRARSEAPTLDMAQYYDRSDDAPKRPVRRVVDPADMVRRDSLTGRVLTAEEEEEAEVVMAGMVASPLRTSEEGEEAASGEEPAPLHDSWARHTPDGELVSILKTSATFTKQRKAVMSVDSDATSPGSSGVGGRSGGGDGGGDSAGAGTGAGEGASSDDVADAATGAAAALAAAGADNGRSSMSQDGGSRRGLSFADAEGGDLVHVHFCDNLHYGARKKRFWFFSL